MSELGSELNKFFDTYSLPTVKKLLNVPDNIPIGTVSPKEMEKVWDIAHKDMGSLIEKIKAKDVDHATDITVTDVIKIAEVYGVPGTNVAGTIAPYVFGFVEAEADGNGKVKLPKFLEALKKSESHMEIIQKNLKEGKFNEASKLSLNDIFEAADVAGGGIYADIAKLTVLVGFGIAENGSLQEFILTVIHILTTIGQTLGNIVGSIFPDGPAQVIEYADGSKDIWDSYKGWIRIPPPPHHITRRNKK